MFKSLVYLKIEAAVNIKKKIIFFKEMGLMDFEHTRLWEKDRQYITHVISQYLLVNRALTKNIRVPPPPKEKRLPFCFLIQGV